MRRIGEAEVGREHSARIARMRRVEEQPHALIRTLLHAVACKQQTHT
jgi:hypothetical protein